MAQEHAKTSTSSSTTTKKPFTQLSWPQRKPIELQQLFELFFSLPITLKNSASTWQSEKRQPLAVTVAVEITLSHATAPRQR